MMKAYKCPFCDSIHSTLFELRIHIFQKHKSDNIKCPYCDFIANTWNDFTIHLLMTNEKKHDDLLKLLLTEFAELKAKGNIFEVEIEENKNDNQKTESESKPQIIENVIEENFVICPYCNKKISSIIDLAIHIDNVHLQNNYSCPYCGKRFKNYEALRSHLNHSDDEFHKNLYYLLRQGYRHLVNKELLKIENQNSMHKCPYCGEKFEKINDLKIHINNIHLLNNYYCPYCKKDFETFYILIAHLWNTNDELHRKLYSLIVK